MVVNYHVVAREFSADVPDCEHPVHSRVLKDNPVDTGVNGGVSFVSEFVEVDM